MSQLPLISGIQQVGVGIPNVQEAFKWYRQNFGCDIPMFDEAAEAELMLPYTAGKPHSRHAIFALNLEGGGGYEIWQYTSRVPQAAAFEISLGDLGINWVKIKSKSVERAHKDFAKQEVPKLGELQTTPENEHSFHCCDPWGNAYEVLRGKEWFLGSKKNVGGILGCGIGVSDMERSMAFYKDLLGYDLVVYDKVGQFEDLAHWKGGDAELRRVLLRHSAKRKGKFSEMLGPSEMELVQVMNRNARKIFENRLWGDLGFIHLCFDITGMDALREKCTAIKHPFTVDSFKALEGKFDMGEAAGHFAYCEDPDGTLIEFVEALKIPVVKKIGWYMNLRKRDPEKPLPRWMLKALRFMRVKS